MVRGGCGGNYGGTEHWSTHEAIWSNSWTHTTFSSPILPSEIHPFGRFIPFTAGLAIVLLCWFVGPALISWKVALWWKRVDALNVFNTSSAQTCTSNHVFAEYFGRELYLIERTLVPRLFWPIISLPNYRILCSFVCVWFSNVVIKDMTILAPLNAPNTDGIDPGTWLVPSAFLFPLGVSKFLLLLSTIWGNFNTKIDRRYKID